MVPVNPSRSLSASFRSRSRRERLVVLAGLAVSAVILLATLVVLPFADRWGAREERIALRRDEVARLRSLIANESATRATLTKTETAHGALRARLVRGTTPALAASDLQAVVQGYAAGNAVNVDRIDVVGQVAADSTPAMLPARISAQGDLYGLVGFLGDLQHGGKLLVIDELSVNAGARRPDGTEPLNLSIGLRAPWLAP